MRLDVEIWCRYVEPERAGNLVKRQNRAIDDLAEATVDILSNETILRSLSPLRFANRMVWCKLDETTIGLDSAVAVTWVAER